MTAGQKLAQGIHVAVDWSIDRNLLADEWRFSEGHLVVLESKNEDHLWQIYRKLHVLDISVAQFYEPDLGGSLTALGALLSARDAKMLSHLPLCFKPEQRGGEK